MTNNRPLGAAIRTDLLDKATLFSDLFGLCLVMGLGLRLVRPIQEAVQAAMMFLQSVGDLATALLICSLVASLILGALPFRILHGIARRLGNEAASALIGGVAATIGLTLGLFLSDCLWEAISASPAAASEWKHILRLLPLLLLATVGHTILMTFIANLSVAIYGEQPNAAR